MTDDDLRLTHVAADGTARMVDVGSKPETERMARATGQILMAPRTLEAILANAVAKGDVLGVARVAGIMAAKRTAELIPLCHPLALSEITVQFLPDSTLPGMRAEAVVRTMGRTGVEMEALTAVTIALLTVYDMAKGMDKSMIVNDIALADKTGGVGGPYTRS
ncbi:MAG: cyclic pyranopterin monophosphate synthase MoaC [Gemmatimonadaceae bacterium]